MAAALVFNAMLFLDFFPLPVDRGNESLIRGNPSIKNAMLYGTYRVVDGNGARSWTTLTRTTLEGDCRNSLRRTGPSIIISTDTYRDQFFMNWRIGRYYLPKQDFWVLYNNDAEQKTLEHIRRDVVLEVRKTSRRCRFRFFGRAGFCG